MDEKQLSIDIVGLAGRVLGGAYRHSSGNTPSPETRP